MSFMGVLCVCLSILIYTKDDKRADNFNDKLGIKIDFGQINSNFSQFIDKTVGLTFLSYKNNGNQAVANVDSYTPKENDLYETNDGRIISLARGTITFLSADKTGHTMVVQYDNGITATYSLLTEVLVQSMDRIDEDDVIASGNIFKIIFTKNGKQIRYEEFFA